MDCPSLRPRSYAAAGVRAATQSVTLTLTLTLTLTPSPSPSPSPSPPLHPAAPHPDPQHPTPPPDLGVLPGSEIDGKRRVDYLIKRQRESAAERLQRAARRRWAPRAAARRAYGPSRSFPGALL